MKIIYNNIIPFPGYKAVNLFGVLFVRKGAVMKEEDINHEAIHTAQMKEMLYILFYLWYIFEWFIKLFTHGTYAYRNISFEREAYQNEDNLKYLDNRKHYSWTKYLKQ